MSTSLKQAIEAAKVRVSAAFDAIEAKGGTKPSVANLAALPSAIESIPSGGGEEVVEKDINFFDHKHLVASYWISEIDSLTELPEPTHYDHLTFDGWTETLEEIKDGKCHEVGAMYHTTNGELRMGVRCDSIDLAISASNLNRVDWGDGQVDTKRSHDYDKFGFYEIVVYGTITNFSFSYYSQKVIEYVELPNTITGMLNLCNGVSNGLYDSSSMQYASIPNIKLERIFFACNNIKYLVIPPNMPLILGTSNNCTLRHIAIPNGVTSVQITTPTSLYALCLSPSVTTLNVSGFRALCNIELNNKITTMPLLQFTKVRKVVVPANVTTMAQYSLGYLYGICKEVHIYGSPTMNGTTFRSGQIPNIYIYSETPPTLTSVATFYESGKPTVHVKAIALAEYQADTNWAAQIANNYLTLVGDL